MPGVLRYICWRNSVAKRARRGFAFLFSASFGRTKSPPRISFPPGSTLRIAVKDDFTSCPYSAALGRPTKYLKFGSFQICQVRIGRLGIDGLAAQNDPVGP